jgi:hypothetical protein
MHIDDHAACADIAAFHFLRLTSYTIPCKQIGYGTKSSLTCQDPKVLKKQLQSSTIMLGSEAHD